MYHVPAQGSCDATCKLWFDCCTCEKVASLANLKNRVDSMKCARRWRRKVGGYTAKFHHRLEDVEKSGREPRKAITAWLPPAGARGLCLGSDWPSSQTFHSSERRHRGLRCSNLTRLRTLRVLTKSRLVRT